MSNGTIHNNRDVPDSDIDLQLAFLLELSDVTVEMLNQTEIDDLLQRVTERLVQLSGGYYGYIATESDCGSRVDILYYASIEPVDRLASLGRYEGIGGTAWADNQPLYTSNYDKEYNNRPGLPTGIIQACAIPINCESGQSGVLCILYKNDSANVEAQLGLLCKFERIIAAAFDNARSHQRKQEELSMLEAMMKINQAIYESTEYTSILDSVCDMIVEGFDANRARVYRYSDGVFEGLANRVMATDVPVEEPLPSQELLVNSTNMRAIEHLEAIHVTVNGGHEGVSREEQAYRDSNGIGCSYIAPLISDNRACGVLSVHKPLGQSDFTNTEMRLIDLLASQLSVTINRQRLMQEIEYQANHDQLTGCVSRAQFERILDERVRQAQAESRRFSLLFVDLDGFKNINDTLGHAAGDSLLIHVANRINKLVDKGMSVARLGGDEFAIVSALDTPNSRIALLATEIAGRLSEEKFDSVAMANVYASVGIAKFPEDGNTARDLLSCADIAMYHAKGMGSGEVREFDFEFGARYRRRKMLQNRIEKALLNDEFELHYQPKIRVSDGQVAGVEALIRWNEPEFASVSPAEWIPLAEENGLIHKIGDWVTHETLQCIDAAKTMNIDLKVSINISATQFEAKDFPQNFLDVLRKSGTHGSLIEVEITETAVMEDIELAVLKLEQIRACGISIAIDDFGVAHSCLAYLADLPLDVVKVDRSFVQRMTSGNSRSMIEPILRLAQSLGLATVVEGVETEQEKDAVIALGCDQIQGYYYSRPVPLSELHGVIEKINSRGAEQPSSKAA